MTAQSIPVHEPQASDYPQVYDGQAHRLGVLDNALAVMVTETLITPPDGSGAATGQETLTFLLPASDPKRALLENERRIRAAGSEFVIRQVVDGWDNMQSMASQAVGMSRWMADNQGASGAGAVMTMVTADAAWYDLASCDPIPSLALTQVGAWSAMVTILQGTGWTFGGTDVKQPNDFSIGQPTTRLQALRLVQQTWGGELQFDSINKTVGLWRRRGEFCQVVYAYRHNMVGDTRTLDTETLATRAWPYGAGNLGIESVNGGVPYIEDYGFFDSRGWPRETRAVTLVNDQLTDPAQLKAWAQAQLALLSQPKPTYELVVAQLPTDPVPNVGDTVTVDDSELALRTQPRVVQRVLDVLQPVNTQLQLANALPALPTASNPAVGGAPTAVASNGSLVLGDGTTGGTGQGFYTAPQGSNPNVWMDAAGVHATDGGGSIRFNLSAITGILTAQAVLEDGSNVPAPVIQGQLTDAQLQALNTVKLLGQITTTQITDQAIVTPKLAAGAVATANLQAFAVLAENIASQTITSTQIASGTIVARNIAGSSITADKLSVGSLSAITANLGTVTAGTITGVTITGALFQTTGAALQILSEGPQQAIIQWNNGCFIAGSSGQIKMEIVDGALSSEFACQPESAGGTNFSFDIQTGNCGFINGNGWNGGVNPTSDARLKDDVYSIGSHLDAVRRLRGVRFRWKNTGRPDVGVVAQEVREVLPELVSAAARPDGSEQLGINLTGLTAVLLEAVKDLAARVDELTDSYVTGHPMVTLES